jgi:hypothetical protein
MQRRSRKVFSAIALMTGVALVAFEIGRFSASGPVERWFWLLVGVLVAGLGAFNFLSEPPANGTK